MLHMVLMLEVRMERYSNIMITSSRERDKWRHTRKTREQWRSKGGVWWRVSKHQDQQNSTAIRVVMIVTLWIQIVSKCDVTSCDVNKEVVVWDRGRRKVKRKAERVNTMLCDMMSSIPCVFIVWRDIRPSRWSWQSIAVLGFHRSSLSTITINITIFTIHPSQKT